MPVEGSNPFDDFSVNALIRRMNDQGAGANAMLAEVIRRLVVEQSHVAEKLGNKLWWLNFWLLAATLAILALTGVLVWTPLREMLR